MKFQRQEVQTSTTRTKYSPKFDCISSNSAVDLIRPEYWPSCSPKAYDKVSKGFPHTGQGVSDASP